MAKEGKTASLVPLFYRNPPEKLLNAETPPSAKARIDPPGNSRQYIIVESRRRALVSLGSADSGIVKYSRSR